MIVKNRLLNYGEMIIYQDNDCFLFSLDSVLLANFITIKLTDKKIIDLCSGNAPVPMLLSFRTKADIFGVEIQKYIFDMGYDSIKENKLNKQITFINADVKDVDNIFESESFDIVTCNPPYFKYQDKSLININENKAIARHEIAITLEQIIEKSCYLLKNGGTFGIVHRPERFMEIIELLKKYHMEPKRVQFVYPKIDKEANMMLIEAVKNGRGGLKILEPFIVHDVDGHYMPKVKKMFGDDY